MNGTREQALCPEQAAAAVLASLRRSAELQLGQPVTKAVLAAPAHYGCYERRALEVRGCREEGGWRAGLRNMWRSAACAPPPPPARAVSMWPARPACAPGACFLSLFLSFGAAEEGRVVHYHPAAKRGRKGGTLAVQIWHRARCRHPAVPGKPATAI